MSLKQTIQTDFTKAFKAKDEVKKATLSGLKSEITKIEKLEGNTNSDLDDTGVMKVILSSIKQRKQSIEGFEKGNRMDLVEKEKAELVVLEEYLPKQLTVGKATEIVKEIIPLFSEESNPNKKVGLIIGTFNKTYKGQFDGASLKKLIESLIP